MYNLSWHVMAHFALAGCSIHTLWWQGFAKNNVKRKVRKKGYIYIYIYTPKTTAQIQKADLSKNQYEL